MKRLGLLMVLMLFAIVLALQTIPAQAYSVGSYVKYYEGIEHASALVTSPRLMRAFALRISLRNPDVSTCLTPGNGGSPYDVALQGTDAFLNAYGCKVAVNASHFNPDLSPNTDILGLLIAGGAVISPAGANVSAPTYPDWPGQLNFTIDKVAQMYESWSNPTGQNDCLETGQRVLQDGVVLPYAPALNPYTGFGLSQDGKYLIMVCVDGRQPGWSDGCYYNELGQFLLDFGAWTGCHMDGGGSTCLVMSGYGVINRPCYGYVRPVGVSLGIRSATIGTTIGPSACCQSANRIDIAFRGNMSNVYIKTWQAGIGWSEPVNIGGTTYDSPAIVSRSNGNMMCLHRGTDNTLYYKTWTTAGGWASSWTSLGASILSGPAACSQNSNNIEVVIRNSDNHIYIRSWNGSWGSWQALGGTTYDRPAICSRANGIREIFVRGTNNELQHNYNEGGGWSGWLGFGGAVVTSGVSAESRDSNHMDVFCRLPDGGMGHIYWDNVAGWSAWENFGGNVGNIACCAPASSPLYTWHKGTTDHLYQKTWVSGSGWTGFIDLGAFY